MICFHVEYFVFPGFFSSVGQVRSDMFPQLYTITLKQYAGEMSIVHCLPDSTCGQLLALQLSLERRSHGGQPMDHGAEYGSCL
jgi:hypothetical protein